MGEKIVAEKEIKAADFQWYAASSNGNDDYVITIGGCGASYEIGRVYAFKADVVNTGAATLNINGIGATAIRKNTNVVLNTRDIVAGQIVLVIYDGTYFQLVSTTLDIMNVGNQLLYSLDAGRQQGGGSYTKHKSIKIYRPGTYRIKFTLSNSDSSDGGYGKIYRNGGAIGTERHTSSPGAVEFSEDIAAWSSGDEIQIYTKWTGTGGQNVALTNFRIYVLEFDGATTEYDA